MVIPCCDGLRKDVANLWHEKKEPFRMGPKHLSIWPDIQKTSLPLFYFSTICQIKLFIEREGACVNNIDFIFLEFKIMLSV
jgi:hypothetical protein